MAASAQTTVTVGTCDPLTIQIPQSSSSLSSSAESGLYSSLSPSSTSTPSSIRQSQSTLSLLGTNASSGMHITFAPLPSPEPRKRRSASQLKLGVASRSSMMRHRQLASVNLNDPDHEGLEVQQEDQFPRGVHSEHPPSVSERWQDQAFAKTKGRAERSRDPDDPLLAMGRLIKSAWRRVSSPQAPPRIGRPALSNEAHDARFSEGNPEAEAERRQQDSLHPGDNSKNECVVEEQHSDPSDVNLNLIPRVSCRTEAADTAKVIAVTTVE